MNLKNNTKFIAIFGFAVILFHWQLITMKSLFIGGDNLVQFYPWFKEYAAAVKHFVLPFWTRYMQSGFPLMAEGQIGGFYPINAAFFLTLPFNFAYNYAIVFHFVVAGVSIYLLARRLGACEWGGTLAALIFCFGSAYAGCFYNIITLRTLSWTPLVFLLFELYLDKKKLAYIITAGIIFGMQLLAGFVQLAAYCWIFYLVYFLYRDRSKKSVLNFLLFSAISFILFLPQLLLTYRLASYSARAVTDLQFALWGSFDPVYLTGLVFPYWSRLSTGDFYLSVFGILFLIYSFYFVRIDKRLSGVLIIFALSLFLSLGGYNPIYVGLLKIFKFYTFRNPSKFLFFSAFAGSLLIGRGFSEFIKERSKYKDSALKIYCIILCSCGSVFLVSKFLLVTFKGSIIKMGQWYVTYIFYAKGTHIYDLNTYLARIPSLYSFIVDGTSLKNIFNIASWLLVILALAISWLIINKRKARFSPYLKGVIVLIIIADLFTYGFIGKGFRGNMRDSDVLKPTHPAIFNHITQDKDIFRVLPYGVDSGKLPFWIMPNTNIIYGIDSVACYTPLANDNYRSALSSLQIIDNSLGVVGPKIGSIEDKITLLRLLNVKYVISAEELNGPYLKFIMNEGDVRLYRLTNNLERAFVLRSLDPESVDSNIDVKMIEYGSGKAAMKVTMPYDGFLAFSENNYPGWEAFDSDKAIEIKNFSLIQVVSLSKGQHLVRFVYSGMRRVI